MESKKDELLKDIERLLKDAEQLQMCVYDAAFKAECQSRSFNDVWVDMSARLSKTGHGMDALLDLLHVAEWKITKLIEAEKK